MFSRLLLFFILVPLAELGIFMTLGKALGLLPATAIIILTAILGASLAKSQGKQAIHRFRQAMGEGRMPHREAIDGILVLLAGAVLLTPGFLTDAAGFLLLLPPVRHLLRPFIISFLKDKFIPISPPPEKPDASSSYDNGKVIDV